MKATIHNSDDVNKGRGYALLVVHFEEHDDKPENDETFTVAIKGHPSEKYLQPPGSDDQWLLGAESYLPVNRISWDGTDLTLELGPYFTEAFQDKIHSFFLKGSYSNFPRLRAETYKILKPPRQKENIDLPDQRAKFGAKPPAEITLMNRTEVQQTSEESSPPLGYGEASSLVVPEANPPALVEPASEPLPLDSEKKISLEKRPISPQPARPKNSKKILGLLLPLVVIVLASVGVWYYLWNKDKSPPKPPLAEQPAQSEPKSENVAPVKPIDEARQLLKENKPDSDLAAAVARLDGTPGAEDAVFLLLRKLAPNSPDYRMRFAAFYDPLDPRPTGSVQKNAKYAYDEYEAARKAGVAKAGEHQDALFDWAEKHEESGEGGAKELLAILDQ